MFFISSSSRATRVSRDDILSATTFEVFCDTADLVSNGDWGRAGSSDGACVDDDENGVENRVDVRDGEDARVEDGARNGR